MAFDRKKAGRMAKTAAVHGGRTVGDIVGLIFKTIGTLVLIFLTTGAIFAMIFALYIRTTLEPQIEISLEDFSVTRTSVILEFDHERGEWIEAVPVESGEMRHWVPYEEINRYLIYAAVAFEDRRFYEHRGVDWFRTAAAFHTMFLGDGQIFGASTITQQLIKNLTLQDDVTVRRKILEIFRAMELERLYTKEEILEWYLNVFALGGRVHGVGAAAQFYYGVDQSELTLAQAASIVGITQRPTFYNPFLNLENNERKRNEVLAAMYAQGFITHAQYVEAINEEIVLSTQWGGAVFEPPVYSFFQETIIEDLIQQFMDEHGLSREAARNRVFFGGLQIYSTMDPRIQAVVDHAYSSHDTLPILRGPAQSAMIIMDHTNGHIVAMAGGIGEKTANLMLNRATQSRLPSGSSNKPIAAFGPAMQLGVIQPNTMVEDAPILHNGRPWPQNATFVWTYDYYNVVRAMAMSTNTIAVRVLNMIGPQQSWDFMTERLHIQLVPEDVAMAPLALGQLTHGLTVREITAAYAAFANRGVFTHPVTYSLVLGHDGEVIFDNTIGRQEIAFYTHVADTMTAMLVQAVVNGTGGEARFPGFDVAGKTGSTEFWRDRWFVGFTPHLTAGVWSGSDQGEITLPGANPSAHIFRQIMRDAHAAAELPPATFQNLTPVWGIREEGEPIEICQDSGLLATEACHDTIQGGDRTRPFVGDRERAPTDYCNVHHMVTVCVISGLLPNSSCETIERGSRVGAAIDYCHIEHDTEEPEPTPTPTPEPTPTPGVDPTPTPTPTDPTPTPTPTDPTPTPTPPDPTPTPEPPVDPSIEGAALYALRPWSLLWDLPGANWAAELEFRQAA